MSPAILEALIILAAKYGPKFVADVCALFKRHDVTVADLEALFGQVKPYQAYNIPDPADPADPAP